MCNDRQYPCKKPEDGALTPPLRLSSRHVPNLQGELKGFDYMSPEMIAGLFSLVGVLIGGLLSWWLQKDRASTDLRIALEAIKTEHMAETTALYYLNHKGYTDRSFDLLRKRLGGFEDDELRRILVRAGAVRYIREDDSEWWRLLSRFEEVAERRRAKEINLGKGNEDL